MGADDFLKEHKVAVGVMAVITTVQMTIPHTYLASIYAITVSLGALTIAKWVYSDPVGGAIDFSCIAISLTIAAGAVYAAYTSPEYTALAGSLLSGITTAFCSCASTGEEKANEPAAGAGGPPKPKMA